MIKITYSAPHKITQEYEYNIDKLQTIKVNIGDITKIYIDGFELLIVRELMNNTTLIPNKNKVILYGDLAKTIIANLYENI